MKNIIKEDNLYRFLGVYRNSPAILKKVVAFFYNKIPFPIRYGKNYSFFKNLVNESEKWDEKKIKKWQLQKLNELLYICTRNIPFYAEKLKNIRLPLKSLDEFAEKIPFTTKNDLRFNSEKFINKNYRKRELLKLTTGGTTAEPLSLYYEKGLNRTKEFVYMNNQWKRVGYSYGDSIMVLRSSVIKNEKNNNRYRYDYIKNRLYISSYYLSTNDIKLYLDLYHKFKPKYLHVYPSVLTLICHKIINHNFKIHHYPRAILSGSENTFPHQYQLFGKIFKCDVFRWYGLGEQSSLAGSCENSFSYHPFSTYSFTELIGKDNLPLKNLGDRGEIVGTPFFNFAFPIIRYKTQDFGYFESEQCNKCGRIGPIISEIEGRAQETIIDWEGNKYSLGPFIFGIHSQFWSSFSAIQFYQEKPGLLEIRSSSESLSSEEQMKVLKKVFSSRFNKFKITYIPNARMEKTRIGKHKFLVQKLNINNY